MNRFLLLLTFSLPLFSAAALPVASGFVSECGSVVCEEEGLSVDTSWSLTYPTAAPGWSGEELTALRRLADAQITGAEACDAARWLRARAEEVKASEPDPDGFSRCLVLRADLKFPLMTDSFAAMAYDGYDYEGGAGCHACGRLLTVRRVPFGILGMDWLSDNPAALRAAVVARLKNTFDDTGAAMPDFIPVAEGIRFRFAPYTVAPGCAGMPETTLTWDTLSPLCRPESLAVLKAAAITSTKGN